MPKTSVAALEVPYTSIPQWYHTLNEATYYDLNITYDTPPSRTLLTGMNAPSSFSWDGDGLPLTARWGIVTDIMS